MTSPLKGRKFPNRKKRDRPNIITIKRDEQPEDALWRNVVTQAIGDAAMVIPEWNDTDNPNTRHGRKLTLMIREQAREWVQRQGDDFKIVCSLAGLEWDSVHKFAMAKIRESIEREQAKIAERLASQISSSAQNRGVGNDFSEVPADRSGSVTRDGAKIEFSQTTTELQPQADTTEAEMTE